jgi:pSer/pThr/pTyr-binding forkhead associated (FHA) protein
VPESVLTVLKFVLLALVYLFLWAVVRTVLRELRTPALATDAGAAAVAPTPGRGRVRGGGRLHVVEPPERRGEDIELDEEITVGRGGGCALLLADDHFVSTLHARVFRRGSDVWVEDLESRNGTFVNGKAITRPVRLKRGDRVQFGGTVVEYQR